MFSREFGKKMPSHGQYLLKQQKAKVCRLVYHCVFTLKTMFNGRGNDGRKILHTAMYIQKLRCEYVIAISLYNESF